MPSNPYLCKREAQDVPAVLTALQIQLMLALISACTSANLVPRLCAVVSLVFLQLHTS